MMSFETKRSGYPSPLMSAATTPHALPGLEEIPVLLTHIRELAVHQDFGTGGCASV